MRGSLSKSHALTDDASAALSLGTARCPRNACSSAAIFAAFATVVVCGTYQFDSENFDCSTSRKLVICSEASAMVCEN